MMRTLFPRLFFLFLLSTGAVAQDSLPVLRTDSIPDTLVVAPATPIDFTTTGYYKVVVNHPWMNAAGKGVYRQMIPKTARNKDAVFYLLLVLCFVVALVKVAFGRYLANLFKVFFRASLKAKQIREQLLQTPLASLLLNANFVATSALLASFLLVSYQAGTGPGFWWTYGYAVLAISLIYLGKHLILNFLGWSLRMKESTDTYIFIVFLCNKVLGIFLLPLLMLIAFATDPLLTVAQTVSLVLVVGILLYRYISAYGFITRELNASRFHFFLYLCAFEVAPLLLIYKVLTKIV